MRIALFTDTYLPQVNGVAGTLGRLARRADRRGHAVAVVCPRHPETDGGEPGSGAGPAESLRLPLASLPFPLYPELRMALPLWSEEDRLKAFRPDLVHVATEFTAGWTGLRWADENGIPAVSSFHTDFPAYLSGYGLAGLEAPMWQYLENFHAETRMTFAPSSATRDRLREKGFREPLRVWSRGVDADAFHPGHRSAEWRRSVPTVPEAETILLYVGRLAPEKKLPLLFDAFRRVRSRSSREVTLVVVGDGPAGEDLRRSAPAGVAFTGYLTGDALYRAYASSDVFAFPSDTETFGNVVLESMASGLPAVAPEKGGVTDTIQPGRNGRLFRPGDPADFARHLTRLVERDALRERMAAWARRYAESRSWSTIFDRLFDDYREAVAERMPVPA